MFYLISVICFFTYQCSIMTGLHRHKVLGEKGNITIESDDWYGSIISCLQNVSCEVLFEDISKFPSYNSFEELQKDINDTLYNLYKAYQSFCKDLNSSECISVREDIKNLVIRNYSKRDNNYYPHLKAEACNALISVNELF